MSIFEPFHFSVHHDKKLYAVTASPHLLPCEEGRPVSFDLTINDKDSGYITCAEKKWKSDLIDDQSLVNMIGSYIHTRYV